MKIDIVTIFPEYFAPLDISLLGKARRAGLLDVRVHDLRTWTHDRHRTVDDTPYGGGPGMVMKPDPWGEALDALVPPPPAGDTPTSPNGPPPTDVHTPTDTGKPPHGSPPPTEPTSPGATTPPGGVPFPGEGTPSDASVSPGGAMSGDAAAATGGVASTGGGAPPDGGVPAGEATSAGGITSTDGIGPAGGGVPTVSVVPFDGSVPAGGAESAGGAASSAASMLRGGALPASGGARSVGVTSSGQIPPSRGSVAPGGAPADEGATGGGGPVPGSAEAPSSGASTSAESAAPGAPGAVPRLIIPTPSGRPFTQADAVRYAAEPWLVFACGRYEGIDSRVTEEARTRMPVDEVSLGDFVLAGGEVAVMVMIEAIARLVPGVLGNAQSVTDDSFAPGAMESLLEGPVYTKPPVWRDRPVPDVLLSGHHGAIARWRRDEALRRTARHRPELLARLTPEDLDEQDRAVLREAGFPVDGEDMAD